MKKIRMSRVGLAVSGSVWLALAGCGGGSSTPAQEVPTTTPMSATVVDGPIANATVCLDKNGNGKCDSDETQGKTNASGSVTLNVPNADLGKYPLVAVVGTDAVDADHGAVSVPYTMSAPADQAAVISPLTTLVQQTVASTGTSTAAAAKTVQDATGITASLFQDFSKTAAPTDGSIDPATVARLLVVTTQAQATAVASAVGSTASDGKTITSADVDKAVQTKLLDLLPDVVTAVSSTAVISAATPADKEAALTTAAQALVTTSGLSAGAMPVVVAVNNQNANPGAVTPVTPEATASLRQLSFTNAANYYVRSFTSSVAQATPDSSNNFKYVERRRRATGGNVAQWGTGSDPARNADLHWNGTAWTSCPINFENTNSVRDAAGNSVYNYCDGLETGKSNRATIDVSGRSMASVYAEMRAAGYLNLYIADPTVLAAATFPSGSKAYYQSSTAVSEAIAYYPGGSDPAGINNVVAQYSAAVAAGGAATSQAAGVACNATETSGNGTNTTTLEQMIALASGTPCVYTQGSVVYGGVTYYSDAANEWWGNSTLSIGTIGTAPTGVGIGPGYYSTNTRLRIAFKGPVPNAVTFYACKERLSNGSTRNCTPIGTGTYSIQTLGDARVLTLSNAPVQAAPLTYNRVFVERGGLIYLGYQSKLGTVNSARLNLTGANALLTQLGIPTEDPSTPWALTAASYQGTWDVKDSTQPTVANGTTIFVSQGGTVSCQHRATASFLGCSLSISDPATGAFTFSMADGTTSSGTLNFMTGTGSGTYHDPTVTPTDGNFVAKRR